MRLPTHPPPRKHQTLPRTNRGLLWLFACLFLAGSSGCQDKRFIPRPKGYPHFVLPDHCYQALPDSFPYHFEYSVHARLLNDSSYLAERYWIEIDYPMFGASIQLTYKPLKKEQPELLREYLSDSYRLTAKHQIKAYSIEERILLLKKGGAASLSYLKGEVPSPIQFHTSDSSRHYLRGALYLNTATKNDSLQPAIQYLEKDILHLLATLRWK